MKRNIFAAFSLALALIPACGLAACGGEDDAYADDGPEKTAGTAGLAYTLSEDGTYYVCSGMGTCTKTEISVASWYGEKWVKEIAASAFEYEAITKVTVPDTVTSIGSSAFYSCENLVSAVLADPAELSSYVFYGCKSLTTVSLGSGATQIGSFAFCGCAALKTLALPAELSSLGSCAFYGCTALEELSLPDGVTVIEEGTFRGCTALTRVTLGSDVISIGEDAFLSCTSLAEIDLPEGVTEVGDYAFGGCLALYRISIPATVTKIGRFAFQTCSALESVSFAGTMEEWQAIEKDSSWRHESAVASVVCSDGTLTGDDIG